MNKLRIALATMMAVAMMIVTTSAQEHPEHPSKTEVKKDPVSIGMLSKAIKDYVAADSKLKGGTFVVYDPVDKKPLALTLSMVHEEKLATLGGGVYFACADFQSSDGKTYDLDIFMKGDENGLETTDVAVHKVNGQPRYNWNEKDGVWSKVGIAPEKP